MLAALSRLVHRDTAASASHPESHDGPWDI